MAAKDQPHRLAEIRVELSTVYSYYSEKMAETLVIKAERWQEIRKECKTDKEADMKWMTTEHGGMEIVLKHRLKAAEKMMSAINGILQSKINEARNLQ